MRYQGSSGFTLVELLVTTAVIGVRASISMVNFRDFKERAYNAKAIAMSHDIVTAMEGRMADFGGIEALRNHLTTTFGARFYPGTYALYSQTQAIFKDVLKPITVENEIYAVLGIGAKGYTVETSHCRGTMGGICFGGFCTLAPPRTSVFRYNSDVGKITKAGGYGVNPC